MIFTHQAALWTARVFRLVALFNQYAVSFTRDLVEVQLFGTSPHLPQTSEVQSPEPTTTSATTCLLPTTHPLSALRLFYHDKVFVQSSARDQIGGGLIGIVVLGSDEVDIETACK